MLGASRTTRPPQMRVSIDRGTNCVSHVAKHDFEFYTGISDCAMSVFVRVFVERVGKFTETNLNFFERLK